jgi:hypothetical protein
MTCEWAEMLAFPLLFLLSLLFFRSLVAALLPLMIGAWRSSAPSSILRIASEVGSISIFALNLTTGLGLGLRSTTASSSSPAIARRSPRTGRAGGDAADAGDGGRTVSSPR